MNTNEQLLAITLRTGINGVCFCGTGTMTSVIIATFAGFVNSYYSNAPLEQGELPPADDRKYPGIMVGDFEPHAVRLIIYLSTMSLSISHTGPDLFLYFEHRSSVSQRAMTARGSWRVVQMAMRAS